MANPITLTGSQKKDPPGHRRFRTGIPEVVSDVAPNPFGDPLINRIIDGHNGNVAYRILFQIGRGGQGAVYGARELVRGNRDLPWEHDDETGEIVAIKMTDLACTEENKKRFRLEIELLNRINHPNIVAIVEDGEYESSLYNVSEYLSGCTLYGLTRNKDGNMIKIDWSSALPIITQVATGLKAAHEKGIIHRDLKPENVMITEEGSVKLIDFGLALDKGKFDKNEFATRITQYGTTSGSPEYMAPERVAGDRGDARCDIYSLGVLMYEMVTANSPFSNMANPNLPTNEERLQFYIHARLFQMPVPPMMHGVYLPAGVQEIIMKCLAIKPEDRFRSVDELLEALQNPSRWLENLLQPGLPPAAEIAVPVPAAPVHKKSRVPTLIGGILIGAASLIGAGYLIQKNYLDDSSVSIPAETRKVKITLTHVPKGAVVSSDHQGAEIGMPDKNGNVTITCNYGTDSINFQIMKNKRRIGTVNTVPLNSDQVIDFKPSKVVSENTERRGTSPSKAKKTAHKAAEPLVEEPATGTTTSGSQ